MSETENAKVHLREHLASLLIPSISEGFWSIQNTANQLCERNKQVSETLRTFQNLVTKIPEWSDSTLTEEVDRILKKTKCNYMDDLLMGVFLAYMKSFAALQYRGASSQIRVEFERPNVSKFIHELYKHSARKLWQSAYLFKVNGVPTEQQSKNRQDIEQIIYKTIDDVVRSFLPWEVIAKSYFSMPAEEEKHSPAPAPSSKSVIFEDLPDEEDYDEDDEEEKPRKIQILENDMATLTFTDLDKPPEPVAEKQEPAPLPVPEEVEPVSDVKEIILDPMSEIEKNISEDSLVLNL